MEGRGGCCRACLCLIHPPRAHTCTPPALNPLPPPTHAHPETQDPGFEVKDRDVQTNPSKTTEEGTFYFDSMHPQEKTGHRRASFCVCGERVGVGVGGGLP